MRPSPEMIPILIDAAKALKASQRRLFMAKTVKAMGRGGQVWAEAHLRWNRETIRKGMHEFRSGMTCVDAFHCRRRKPAEEHLPRLLDDIRSIADGQSQADTRFQTNRLFTRISAAEVRRQLIATKGYAQGERTSVTSPCTATHCNSVYSSILITSALLAWTCKLDAFALGLRRRRVAHPADDQQEAQPA